MLHDFSRATIQWHLVVFSSLRIWNEARTNTHQTNVELSFLMVFDVDFISFVKFEGPSFFYERQYLSQTPSFKFLRHVSHDILYGYRNCGHGSVDIILNTSWLDRL
jgi:hypothetical protein